MPRRLASGRVALVVAILFAAALLRVTALDRYPVPYHQDELTDVYDGYSIATTGADRTGERWPILIRSMGPGGYCPTLNMYLCAVATAIGGFNAWAGRMPAVIGGMLTVWLVFVLARRLLGNTGGVLALLFVALSPIHTLYSRQVHAGTYLPPLFAMLILYLLDRWMEPADTCGAAALGAWTGPKALKGGTAFHKSYDCSCRSRAVRLSWRGAAKTRATGESEAPRGLKPAAQIVAEPMKPGTSTLRDEVLTLSVPDLSKEGLGELRYSKEPSSVPQEHAGEEKQTHRFEHVARNAYGWLVLVGLAIGFSTNAYTGSRITALLFAAVACAAVLGETGLRHRRWSCAVKRAGILTIAVLIGAAPTIYAAATTPEAFFSRGAHVIPPMSNGPRWWLATLTGNVAANLNPRYLFLSFGEYRHLSVERLGIGALPFLYVGLLGLAVQSVRRRDLRTAMIPLGVLIGLAPGVLSTGNPNPMRTSIVWSIYPIAAAFGVLVLGRGAAWLLARARFGWIVPSLDRLTTRLGRVGMGFVCASIVVCGASYTIRYVHRDDLQAAAAQRRYVEVGTWLRDHGKDYDRVYIDVDGIFGYLYVAALSGMAPVEFQQTPREGVVTAMGWDYIDRLGRYYFEPIEKARREWQVAPRNERWLLIEGVGETTELVPDARVTTATP